MRHSEFVSRLAQPADTRIVLLILDGLGDLRSPEQPKTALELARTPNLDALARRSALGRIVPVAQGVTPGSGPAHLSLFGYDPRDPEADIGRGVLEALGLGLDLGPAHIAARGNFASADAAGNITDRRAGRIATREGRRLCAKMTASLENLDIPIRVRIEPGEAYRFVLLLEGDGLRPQIADTDPQRTGTPSLPARATVGEATETADTIQRVIAHLETAIDDEPQANRILLRGFSSLPDLPAFPQLYKMRAGAFAGYPLYRGVAAACGMTVVACSKQAAEAVTTVGDNWDAFEFFFVHVKQTDQAGEDGDIEAKSRVIEQVDEALPALLALGPDVLAITGDHSTPAPMKAHSWHPVPLLLHSDRCFIDQTESFDEIAATNGHLGTIPSTELLGLMMANAGRLAKFGA
ncbi:MAG: 2,3-bisphosphoglycerate-independent phosphoglycerate mutase [Acidobacteriota bacterium]|nr:2,3-bisphosphoglycerate-independent phosphoglycerate mutase [Acidobacteriota bacterium]